MVMMGRYPDKYFDLAIVDPPYGLNFGNYNRTNKNNIGKRYRANKYPNSDWDTSIPSDAYFDELFRVSKNQIIWGGNYFPYIAKKETPNLKTIEEFRSYISSSFENWIFWYKQNPVANFADGELAWTSLKQKGGGVQFNFRYFGNIEGNTSASVKIHPTQKPVQLYKWLLENFAIPGYKIIDTHLGSGSIAVACFDYGYDLTACDNDKNLFPITMKRIENHITQLKMF